MVIYMIIYMAIYGPYMGIYGPHMAYMEKHGEECLLQAIYPWPLTQIWSSSVYIRLPLVSTYCRVVLQTSLEIFLSVNFGQFLGLDGPCLALLGPLLASPASGLTPSTCGNPVSTRSKQIFDQKYFRNFFKNKNRIFRS